MSKAQLTESGLPARVREIVADLLVFCRQEIAARIETTLDQLDVHLLRLHDQARDTHIQRRLLRAHHVAPLLQCGVALPAKLHKAAYLLNGHARVF